MAMQAGDLRHLWSGETERITLRGTLAYRRMLGDLAQILTSCRRRRGLKVEAISQQTGVPVRRLQAYENGEFAVSWPEFLLMAPAYGVVLSVVTRRLQRVLVSAAGEDAHRIEAYLQCHRARSPELTNVDRERVSQKLNAALNTRFVDVTIADWPSCFPPGLSTLLRVEHEMIVAQMKGLNECIARVGADGAGSFAALCVIHQSLIMVATSLEWQLKRHCRVKRPSLLEGDEPESVRHSDATAEERTMRSVGEGIRQCRAIVLHAASKLEPFTGSEAEPGNGRSSTAAAQSTLPRCLYFIRSPALDYALFHSVLSLGNAATRLGDLERLLS